MAYYMSDIIPLMITMYVIYEIYVCTHVNTSEF